MFYGHQCMVLFASETRARAILAETLPEISAVQSLPSPDSGCDVHCALCDVHCAYYVFLTPNLSLIYLHQNVQRTIYIFINFRRQTYLSAKMAGKSTAGILPNVSSGIAQRTASVGTHFISS